MAGRLLDDIILKAIEEKAETKIYPKFKFNFSRIVHSEVNQPT